VRDTITVSLQREATVSLPEVSEDFGQTTALSNAFRFPKEIVFFFFEGSQTSPVCPSGKEIKTNMEHFWNDTDKGKQKCLEKNLS
jgi:carbonic anhydrase